LTGVIIIIITISVTSYLKLLYSNPLRICVQNLTAFWDWGKVTKFFFFIVIFIFFRASLIAVSLTPNFSAKPHPS